MSLTREEVEELSQLLDARAIGSRRVAKPKLRLVVPPTPKLLDSISRDAHLNRIYFLKRRYGLEWLVEQETFDVASASCLEDCDLIRLLSLMERARECIMDGISFEDAGLVRAVRRTDLMQKESRAIGYSAPAERDFSSIALTSRPQSTPIADADSEPPF